MASDRLSPIIYHIHLENASALRKIKMDEKQIKAIESVLAKGDRVELIPGPNDSVKIIHIKRKTVKTEHIKECSEC